MWQKVYFTGQPVMTSSPKKLWSKSQSQTCNKKRSWSLFGGVWFTTAFWIPAKPLHLRSMLSKSMTCTKTVTLAGGISQQKGFILLHDNAQPHVTQPTLQKLNELGYKVWLICHIHLASHQMTPTSSSILTTFCWEKCFHSQQDAENLFQEFIKSHSMDFYATGVNKLISC